MDRLEFERLSLKDVLHRAHGEGSAQRGKPLYFDRPWSQVRDEMDGAEVRTVGALDAGRVAFLHEVVTGT
jgi:hypothetical protein